MSFLENGAIAVKGNVITNDAGYQYYAYQCTDIKLIGSGNQTISGTGVIHDLDIQKVGGDVLLSGNLSLLSGKLTGSGLLKNTGGLVKIIGAYEFDFGGSIDDVEFDTAQKIIFSQELTVNNDLRITNVSFLEDGAIAVKGNVITNDAGYQSYAYQCTDIKLIGSGNQTISGTGVIHDLDIQKVGGDVLLSGNLSLLSGKLTGSGLLKNTGGLVKIIGAYEFDFGGSIDDVEFDTAQKIIFSQELTVNNDLRITNVSFLENGAIAVKGNVITNDAGYQYYAYQCTDIKLIGSGDQTISGTGVIHYLDHDKPNGLVIFDPAFTPSFYQVDLISGNWEMNDQIAVSAAFNIEAGTLSGAGEITGNVIANGGSINPGTSPGCLTINGNLTLNTGSTAIFEIDGETACTQHDQLIVNGNVSINGATLDLQESVSPSSEIILINNDLTDGISGSKFASVNEGDIVTLNGDDYAVTYVGGDGNDMSLMSACDVTITSIDVDSNCPGSIVVNATCTTCSNIQYSVNGTDFQNDSDFSELAAGNHTVTVRDENDHSCNATTSITIAADTEAPTATCGADISANTSAGTCEAVVNWTTAGQLTFSDNCGINGGTVDFGLGAGPVAVTDPNASIGGTYPAGSTQVTYTISDAAGLTASCSFNVVVTDAETPTITCPADFTGNTEPGICQANLDLIHHATATDNCGDVTITSDATLDGVRYIRLTQNLVGLPINLAELEVFQSGINIAALAIVTQSSNAGYPLTNLVDGDLNNFMHTLNGMGQWVEVDLGSEQNIEYIRVHNRGGSCCGNRSESFILEYKDASNNVILSDNDFDVYEGVNAAHFVNDYVRTYLLGDNLVTWTVTDAAGNTATCPQVITVIDNQNPTIECPVAVSQTVDTGVCEAAVTIGTPVTGDNCGVASITNDYNNTSDASDTYPVGTTMVTWTVVDDNGLINSCVQNVVITDDEDPEITCPADIVVNAAPGECFVTVIYTEPVGTDNCTGAVTTLISGLGSGGTPSVGTDNVTFEVTDAAGRTAQCTFNVTVQDTEAPTAICAADFTVNLDAGQMAFVDAAAINNGSTDNCGTVNVSITGGQTAYTCDDLDQTYEVTLTVSDGNATSADVTCFTMVTVGDANSNCNAAPIAVCQDITASTDVNCMAVVTAEMFNNGSNDPDGDALIFTVDPVGPYALGNTPVTLTVSDGSLSSTCTATITVVDTEAPALSGCPSDETVECDAVPSAASVTATDNCDATSTVNFTEVRTDGASNFEYTLERTWTTTDAAGNSSSCSQTITVVDTQAPVLSGCPSDATVECDAVPTEATVTATDNCDATSTVNFAEVRTDGASNFEYTLERTWTTTDEAGNSNSCSQTITVVDTEAPVLSGCPSDETVECDAVPSAVTVTATDNCDATSTVSFAEVRTDGASNFEYTLTRTWTTTDAAGNSSSCSQTITVEDTQAPALSGCPSDANSRM